jgi:NarL family two-component system sensor histidine kinase LiaS
LSAVCNYLKRQLSWTEPDTTSVITYYRYFSLLVTSCFYLIGPPEASLFLKMGTVFCLLLETYTFVRIYTETTSTGTKRILVFIETVGLALILIITGGLDSPFIWYAINPIFLSATLTPTYYCWLMMITFLSSATFLQRYSLYTPKISLSLWPDRSWFFIVFFLGTFAAQISTCIVTKLSRQAEIMKKQLHQIKALYEAIQVFSHDSDPHEVANLFASYIRTLTGAKKVIVWVETQFGVKDPVKNNFYVVRGPRNVLSEETWYPCIKSIFENKHNGSAVLVHSLPSGEDQATGKLITVKVKSSSNVFGVISAYYLNGRENMDEERQILTFLADFCAGILEKRFLESLAEEFLLMEEKDRIAGEIHDSVTQNIFGVIYGLDILMKREPLSDDIRNQLKLMQRTAKKSLKDLRTSIYCMSSAKSETEALTSEVGKYLSDLGQLNNVTVDFSVDGNLTTLNSLAKKSLYRIVREATGNAIRHGCCSNIWVSLKSDGEQVSLVVVDDGIGFEPHIADYDTQCGLGIINMKELARNMKGEIVIESSPGKGTVVSCTVPLLENTRVCAAREKVSV